MAKVEFERPVKSVTGILLNSDPYYLRRYPKTGGGVMHIAQARPDRSKHIKTAAERANQIAFGIRFGKKKHEMTVIRRYKNQLSIEFV